VRGRRRPAQRQLGRLGSAAGRGGGAGRRGHRLLARRGSAAHDFGKNTWHSLEITRRLAELAATGWPVLVSMSNKDFIGETLDAPVDDRLAGTLAATTVSAWLGARVFRVHQVRETRDVLTTVSVIRGDLAPARVVRGLA
jgi:dihydropteroate synthase